MNEDLAAWKTRDAPDDFADRVMARLPTSSPRRVRYAAAALLVIIGVAGVMLALRGPVSGSLTADARTTAAIADRAVVVAEARARLSWTVEPNGRARVQHERGTAFYRVDPGEAFVVNTPYGSIDVRGTCFSVEVSEMGTMTRPAGLSTGKTAAMSAVLSAAMTGAVFVTVYEGRVALGSSDAPVFIEAGERGYATPGQAAKKITQTARQNDSAFAAEPATPGDVQLRGQIAALEGELAKAKTEIASLKSNGAPAAAAGKADTYKPRHQQTFRPGPQELAEMAKACELRIDLPGGIFNREPPSIGPRWRDGYNLSDEETAAVKRVMTSFHAEVLKSVREMYVLVTGDSEAAKWLSPQAMFEELEDKTAEETQALSRQRISAERAGLQAPPQDLSTVSPGERYLRWFTSLPDALEQRLAKEVGPERAKAMHDKYEGWQGARWSTNGCPGEK